jgi:hypothetical protein
MCHYQGDWLAVQDRMKVAIYRVTRSPGGTSFSHVRNVPTIWQRAEFSIMDGKVRGSLKNAAGIFACFDRSATYA